MRMAFKVSGIFIALIIIIAIIPAIIPDEEYTPDVEQWLKDANNPEKIPAADNRFNALIGLYVSEDKDMLVEGAKLVTEMNQKIIDANNTSTSLKLNDYWQNPPLQAGKNLSSLTAKAFDSNPAQWLSKNQNNFNSLVKNNRVLLERFRKIITMDKYSYTMKLDIRAPLISFGDILAIKRLNNLSIINEYSRKNKSDTILIIAFFSRWLVAISATSK